MSQGIDSDMQEMAMTANVEQKQRCPVDFGTLRSRTQFSKIGVLNYGFTAATNYAAYVEFGTGGLVEIPNDLIEEAALHMGKGKRQVNMNAQPFFYAPIFKGSRKLIQKIKDRFK